MKRYMEVNTKIYVLLTSVSDEPFGHFTPRENPSLTLEQEAGYALQQWGMGMWPGFNCVCDMQQ
jgi:hypothetical protein